MKLKLESDYIAPSQACVVHKLQPKPKASQEASNGDGDGNDGGQVRVHPVKISLHDCLACSGCVTSAETVLLEQQSFVHFLDILQPNGRQGNHHEHHRVVVVSVSAQSRTALAKHWRMSPLDAIQVRARPGQARPGIRRKTRTRTTSVCVCVFISSYHGHLCLMLLFCFVLILCRD